MQSSSTAWPVDKHSLEKIWFARDQKPFQYSTSTGSPHQSFQDVLDTQFLFAVSVLFLSNMSMFVLLVNVLSLESKLKSVEGVCYVCHGCKMMFLENKFNTVFSRSQNQKRQTTTETDVSFCKSVLFLTFEKVK